MPTSATGSNAAAHGFAAAARVRGMSLIELLVVVAIVAIVATAVTLSVDLGGAPRIVEREARRLDALVRLACERAQMSGHDYGVHLARTRYAFSVFVPTGWKIETREDLRPRELPRGAELAATREGIALELKEQVPPEPQAVCFASGELSPFDAEVAIGGSRHALHAQPDGEIELEVLP